MKKHHCTWQFFVPFLGWLSDPFEWLSDLQLGDEKVTLTHLVSNCLLLVFSASTKNAEAPSPPAKMSRGWGEGGEATPKWGCKDVGKDH